MGLSATRQIDGMGHGVHFPISVCVLFNPTPGILSSKMTFLVAAVDKWMVALERKFKENLVLSSFRLYAVQSEY